MTMWILFGKHLLVYFIHILSLRRALAATSWLTELKRTLKTIISTHNKSNSQWQKDKPSSNKLIVGVRTSLDSLDH